jgi:transcriptional regulator with XRE-family HTH domain
VETTAINGFRRASQRLHFGTITDTRTEIAGSRMSPNPKALAEFLRARREQLRPEDVGLPSETGRRVRGLRRSEIAHLAHISEQYYTRLEQGRIHQPSYTVLARLVTALALDEYAAAYFYTLALPAPPTVATPRIGQVSDLVIQLVAHRSDMPVVVTDRNQDVLLINDLGSALFPTLSAGTNVVEAVFATPHRGRALEGWKEVARQTVAALRYNADPVDTRLQQIVGALSVRDADFRDLWGTHQANPLEFGVAPVLVDGFGFGTVPWHTLEVAGGYFLTAYLATPDTFSFAAIDYLRRRRGAALTAPDPAAVEAYLERAEAATLAEIAKPAAVSDGT